MAAPILTMTHYLFLTRDQRYVLNVPESELEVIGTCTPVWIHNGKHMVEHTEEVFCKYTIKHCPEEEKQTINITEDGFLIRLSPNMPDFLLDYPDKGAMYLNITHKNWITMENKIVPIVHFLSIEDMFVLSETLC